MKRKLSSSIFGIVIAVGIIALSVLSTTENHLMYVNMLGLMLVIGGTLGAAVLMYSLSEVRFFLRNLVSVFLKPKQDLPAVISELLSLAAGARVDANHLMARLPHIQNSFCREAVQLVVDGLPTDEIRNILRHSVLEAHEREMAGAHVYRHLSRFPPAFGMIGTLIGLIAMLQGMGGGDILRDLGPHMSVALVATFYGILTTNMFLLPMAENIEKQAQSNAKTREVIASGVLMIQEKIPLILIRERLKTYLSEEEKPRLKLPQMSTARTTGASSYARTSEQPRDIGRSA